jgi:glycine/D-amino acid oxidase-like deaminating enzyme
MEIDYLIIGQGLAGSLLAWELIQRNKRVVVIDDGKDNASLMAAGLINPLTGMRLVKTAHVEKLLPVAIAFYQTLSHHFNEPFYIEKPLLRVLNTHKELLTCQKRQQQAEYHPYLSQKLSIDHSIISAAGLVKQQQTGYLLCKPLLTALKNYFIAQNAYIKTEINYADIKLTPHLQWKQLTAKKLIFCEGHHARHNPWFSYLPFQPVKGEIITATAIHKIPQNIINYGHWFIPLNSNTFRTGSTFDREHLDSSSTEDAKYSLLTSLKQVMPSLSIKTKITQQAGIRPTTLDKQPFTGNHPAHPKLIIFNGFGAKGSLQIPWYCQNMADYLIHNKTIAENSNIMRYAKSFL